MFLCQLFRRLIPAAPPDPRKGESRNAEGQNGADRIRQIDAATAIQWQAKGEAVIVDVREPHEHAAGHVPGAILNPLSRFDPSRVPAEPGKHLVFHCQGGTRCGPAAERMMAAGYTGTVNRLRGGFAAWVNAGGTVER
ncbi:rhodanese-like domain-containing protein [Azospirillum sp. YIM B02556]|uniref:Rhodanese-like domain-containing protein n=1 Tax=Azospirillum endophyticum TaxID=2800326 RepID=A0ABS1EYT3_9PROT|nr:rhodanese-like domain-containing protein [Azospirillum endophyticum]MBK1836332.1 rhodanese-like domain-containing protein [Azospirillum endophyticum]